MRVIAGSSKGTHLAPVPRGVRPVSDRAREGLFSSLAGQVPGSRVLDLYAGTGALAIEALSRGAAGATLVERDARARRAISENLARTRLADRARLVGEDALRFVARPEHSGGPFDLVFLDPPYAAAKGELADVLAGVSANLLAGDAWTVAVTRPRANPTLVVPVHWRVARRLEYGDSLVICYREAEGG